jgi:hypothetical protein
MERQLFLDAFDSLPAEAKCQVAGLITPLKKLDKLGIHRQLEQGIEAPRVHRRCRCRSPSS